MKGRGEHMAAVYDGNNIGVLDGGTTFAALDTQALAAATPTAIVAADRGRVSTGIVNGTSDYLYLSFTTGTGLSATKYLYKLAVGQTMMIGGAYAQAAIYGYSVAGGNVNFQTASG